MSQKYYTQNGEYIKNPKGYAKTGAPLVFNDNYYNRNNSKRR